jgi:hypothetical protein
LSSTTITIDPGLAQPGRRIGADDVEILIVGTIEIEPERRAALSHIAKYRIDWAEPVRDAEGRYRAGFTAQYQL